MWLKEIIIIQGQALWKKYENNWKKETMCLLLHQDGWVNPQ